MKLTKYEHACFAVEQNGQTLVVDPGNFTTDLSISSDIIAVVLTHEHADHLDPKLLEAIVRQNPKAVVVAHPSVTSQLDSYKTQSVVSGQEISVGPFKLRFYGDEHAIIHPDIDSVANLGVFINDTLYYPGDAFVKPNAPVDVLALPVGAPWLKISEPIDFARAIKPRFAFPVHDAVLSGFGQATADRLIKRLVTDVEYSRLSSTTPIDI